MIKEREAMEAQRGLDNERRSVQSIEEELAKLQKCDTCSLPPSR